MSSPTSSTTLKRKEIIGLIATCGSILAGVVTVIEHATQSWDRAKKGKKYLDNVVVQIKITRDILEKIVKVETDLQSPEVYSAVELVNQKAKELEIAVQSLTKSFGESNMKVFLDDLIRGNARAEEFDRLQRDLYQAQTILITSLVANKVNNTNVFIVNIKTIDQIKQCFTEVEGVDTVPPIVGTLKKKGIPIGDGAMWQINKEDLEALTQEAGSSDPRSIRVIANNTMSDFALATADIGAQGQAAPTKSEQRRTR
ncbi:hypothetical protein CHU98_g7556 [Xylaria longipes]|nr:hypothetical protein CHU98_g7556 [Xylaria longipes]